MTIKNEILYNIFNTINSTLYIEELSENLKSVFADMYEISEINIIYYDKKTSKFKNVLKDFEPAEDYFSTDKLKLFSEIYLRLNNTDFVINDDVNLPDDIITIENIITKSLSIPLKVNAEIIGFLRIRFKNKFEIKEEDIQLFEMLNFNISLKVENIMLTKQLEINNSFNRSMQGIAKIIETQYDFQYIIPLIGEMIDKFVPNHLVYIFVKKDEKFNLYWPGACWNKEIYTLIEELDETGQIKLSENSKTGVFPIISEKEIIGCIVAHSITDKLTEEEINYIIELTKQSSITIERANVYSEILKNATMDALTGLNNRRQFEKRLHEEYSIATRQNTPLCAMMIDIDFFKKFNDTYGHSVGDIVLKTTASTIKEQLREYDIPSRYGGEEFCILLPQTTTDEAKIVADRLRLAVENKQIEIKPEKNTPPKNISVTISIGLAELDIKDMAEDLYMKADSALYKAKENGRNRVVVYEK